MPRAPSGKIGDMDSGAASPRVLVVDDDPDVLASLERGLRLSGFDVCTAIDGAEALRSATETRPDAIVLDINMPVLDGVSVVTALRAMDNDVPVCVLSARSSVDDRVAGLEAGADDYMVKPFVLTELVARVKALLRRRGSTATFSRRPSGRPAGGRHPRRAHGQRRRRRPHQARVRPARRPRQHKTEVADPRPAARAGVGLRLRRGHQRRRRVHRVPAPQARGRRRAPAPAHRARGGVRPEAAVAR